MASACWLHGDHAPAGLALAESLLLSSRKTRWASQYFTRLCLLHKESIEL